MRHLLPSGRAQQRVRGVLSIGSRIIGLPSIAHIRRYGGESVHMDQGRLLQLSLHSCHSFYLQPVASLSSRRLIFCILSSARFSGRLLPAHNL